MSNEPKTTNKIDFYTYVADERKGRKAFWTKVGIAFRHQKGEGINIIFKALPVDGVVTLFPADRKEETEQQ